MNRVAALVAGIALLFSFMPLLAHHPVDNDFDKTKYVTLTGTVNRVEWVNPHSNLYLEVKDADGKMQTWTVELGSMDLLSKNGWTKDSVRMGDQVTANAWLAKDGSKRAHADSITLTRTLTMSPKGGGSETARTKPSAKY
jgi:Family of unknown function (DUF6152)